LKSKPLGFTNSSRFSRAPSLRGVIGGNRLHNSPTLAQNPRNLLMFPIPLKVRYQLKGKDMTYILGAKCVDGVALVGDTKVTIDEGADFAYEKKIIRPLKILALGSSGMSGIFEDFQNRIKAKMRKFAKELDEGELTITHSGDISILITKTIREMHDDYKEHGYLIANNLEVISATAFPTIFYPSSRIIPELNVFSGLGFPEPVNEKRAIGHGEPYGALFLKEMWNENMTMRQATKLGIFIIKFIQDMHLDNSVGYDDRFLPQVVQMPNIKLPPQLKQINRNTTENDMEKLGKILDKHPIRELENEEVNRIIDEIEPKINNLKSHLKKDIFKFD
jgi:20S proteasome alpha/beta subunit